MEKPSEILILKPQFSKIFFTILFLIHSGALICAWCNSLSVILKLLFTLVIIIYFVYVLYFHVLRKLKISISEIVFENKKWYLKLVNGEILSANLLNSSIVTRYLVILNFEVSCKWRKFSLPLFLDSESPPILKKLRSKLLVL